VLTLPFDRRGAAEGYVYVCTVLSSEDAWRWQGHRYSAADRRPRHLGFVVASGGPYKTVKEAQKAADRWFFSIRDMVEEPFSSIFYRY
jgi:hypothetical protein